MVSFKNPALSEESRYEPAQIAPLTGSKSLLDWLKRTGRIKSYEPDLTHDKNIPEELENIIVLSISELELEEEEK